MINTQGKLLLTAFIIILLGIVLIQPIGDDVEVAKTASLSATNETLAFIAVTIDVSNESQANTGNASIGATYTLTFDDLSAFTAVRNQSATVVTSDCNATLIGGIILCNATNSTNLFFDYTYNIGRIETLTNDELIGIDALRNETSDDITGWCNVTLSTGGLVCNNTYSSIGYADYRYTPDTYVRNSTARTLLTITVLLFAIAVLILGIAYAWNALKDSGVL